MVHSSRHSNDEALPSKRLNLLRQQLVLLVAVAQLARVSPAPAPEGAVGGEGEAVAAASSRHGDDALASKGLDLLWQQLVLLVAVAQLAKVSTTPAPDAAVGGEGEAVVCSSRHSDDALVSKGLDLLGLPLGLLVAVAQLARGAIAPAPDGAVGAVRARLCVAPADTATTRWPAKASTFFGSSWSCRSPWPNRPKPPKPQLQTAPSAVRARPWLRPAERATTRCPANASTFLGSRWSSIPSVPPS